MYNDIDFKRRVVREAATLLYFGIEKEYKQAKQKAAQTLGTHFLPSNLEVALELDKVAEENEGEKRKSRLIEMRRQALTLMKLMSKFSPLLIGSVWRGTIKRNSDIDVAVYTDNPESILSILKSANVIVAKTQWISVNKKGETLESYHIHLQPSKYAVEIVVRNSEQAKKKRRCEIFGDELKGLTIQQLETVLQSHPTKKFIPQ